MKIGIFLNLNIDQKKKKDFLVLMQCKMINDIDLDLIIKFLQNYKNVSNNYKNILNIFNVRCLILNLKLNKLVVYKFFFYYLFLFSY